MEFLLAQVEAVQTWLFEQAVLPLVHGVGLMAYVDDAYEATGLFVLGIGELAILYLLLRPLEAWRPVERWQGRGLVRPDIVYTLLHRTGVLPLLFFILLQPLLNGLDIALRDTGYLPPNLEEWIPGLSAYPLVAFFTYIVVIDFFEYWRHRLQHLFNWWWALHSIHHSQQQMSFWADDRNHVFDSLIEALWLALLALLIGIAPAQFVGVILVMRLIENLSHANVRLGFGAIGDRLLVSPRFHRIHHGIGVGHEGPRRGCNFATLFPIWDILFGTANFARYFPPTGVRDQLQGADYGKGFLSQQVNGAVRLARALVARRQPSA